MTEQDVMEFGDDAPRRPPLTALWSRIGAGRPANDRRLQLGMAGVGGVLVLISLFQVWQVTAVDQGEGNGRETYSTQLAGLNGWGAGVLLGVFGLSALAAMVLFGPPQVRKLARIAALGWAGSLGGLLLAVFVTLGQATVLLNFSLAAGSSQQMEFELSHGPGPYLALLGVGAVTAAIYLTDRRRFGDLALDDLSDEEDDLVDDDLDAAVPAVRPRRPAPSAVPAVGGPIDLTVSSATPFTHLPESYHDR